MAYSPGPQSPGAGPAYMATRNRSASPPGASGMPSKRDKRRTALQERLHDLTATFSQNRDAQFRQQLHSLQCDMTLINNADPYQTGPLPDSSADIARLIEETFVQEINNVKEQKDADLAQIMNRHQNSLERHRREYDFRVHFAKEEFNQLSGTLRERLMQSISSKRSRLMREKEQLDIADTNALLLHPNQFSITNPASPGGSMLNKRKRKAPEEEPGSPAREAGGTTPAERSKAYVEKQSAPTYSIQSLFTDKELSAHSNQAHVATVHFFSTSKRPEQGSGAVTNGNNTETEDTLDGTVHEENGTPSATDMMRTASQNFHITRSTRGTAAHSALSALADLADKNATRPALPYHVLSNYHARPNGNAPPLTSLLSEEVDDDLSRVDRLHNSKAGAWIDASLVDLVVAPLPSEPVDGRPPNPDRFTSLHPDFPAVVGMQLQPVRSNPGAEVFPAIAMERERSTKRSRHH
ncbi:hypothetical protein N7539_001655 [Penicillium diatomitis]|uniref:Deacetylase complex subunit Sds3 n=1 Tax=Penicillium diatomitis TaxID=2819901 RepID=A0A9X0C0F1_9EURO|nr:uncharacterized protein N7539_001655 [Penicillium diatomitis]KAJ5492909.1 hypothetical protein N7539_001655 [Penicillium diatomitis]